MSVKNFGLQKEKGYSKPVLLAIDTVSSPLLSLRYRLFGSCVFRYLTDHQRGADNEIYPANVEVISHFFHAEMNGN